MMGQLGVQSPLRNPACGVSYTPPTVGLLADDLLVTQEGSDDVISAQG